MTLPMLVNAVGGDRNVLIAALDRLHQQRVIDVKKWKANLGFVPYEGFATDSDFFQRGDFQMRTTPIGRPYFEVLHREAELDQLGVGEAIRKLTEAGDLVGRWQAQLTQLGGMFQTQNFFDEAFRSATEMRNVMAHLDFSAASSARDIARQMSNKMNTGLAAQLESIMGSYGNIGRQLSEAIDIQNKVLHEFPVFTGLQESFNRISEQSNAISEMTSQLTRSLQVTWPADVLAPRLDLLEGTLKNVNAWQHLRETVLLSPPIKSIDLQMEGLDVAGHFVRHHNLFVRRLPPPVAIEKNDDVARYDRTRGEEVGAKLDDKLAQLDQRLVSLRKRAWEDFAKGDEAGARLAAHGVREVFGEVLHRLAPDEMVKKTPIWESRAEQSLRKPTRRMRVEYVMGQAARELDALLQFGDSLQATHKFAHTFAENTEVVRVYLSMLENYTYLLLTYEKFGKN